MKLIKQISLIVLLFAFGCKTSSVEEGVKISASEVKQTVSFLASDDLKGRNTGSEGIEKAAVYIENAFKKQGLKPYFETYRDNFKVGDLNAYNIVGFLEGTDEALKDEVIIIGAHYDHIGIKNPIDGDDIANGANDNAAGSSAVLALAKYFTTKKNNKRSLLFVLFSAEEKGLLGSNHLAKKLKAEELNLYTMLNFEMIGVPFKDRDYTAFITGFEYSNIAEKINSYVGEHFTGASEVAKKYGLFSHSDNFPFYEAFHLPCHTISSCDLSNYDFYHHVDDEIDKLDYDHMANLINKIIPAIEKMATTPTKEIVLNEK